MLSGISSEKKPLTRIENAGLLPDDIMRIIFQLFDLKTLLTLRRVSKSWHWLVHNINLAPLLNSEDIKSAEKYIYDHSWDAKFLALPNIVGFNVSIHPCPDSVDELLLKYTDKFVRDDGKKGWVPDKPTFFEREPIQKILLFIDKERYQSVNHDDKKLRILNTEFNCLATREERHKFICTYLNCPLVDEKGMPRWNRLVNQSMESLDRLKASLNRYTDLLFKNCIAEVDLAIAYKAENTYSGARYNKSLTI
ncbi:F-box protein [Candidatus Berkiella cookevillensis]|uniref:F-box domain protein n=1 Tax=Candidatus Berkiella cookevillensis TaxID=437022 RepID=A0A0Q9YEP3_9GAMM|nr:F-box protein [Candidatus Berkiella cookevillensis]MCS5709324.1 F-box protein [Candidatus Berkiella cookevillensis]